MRLLNAMRQDDALARESLQRQTPRFGSPSLIFRHRRLRQVAFSVSIHPEQWQELRTVFSSISPAVLTVQVLPYQAAEPL